MRKLFFTDHFHRGMLPQEAGVNWNVVRIPVSEATRWVHNRFSVTQGPLELVTSFTSEKVIEEVIRALVINPIEFPLHVGMNHVQLDARNRGDYLLTIRGIGGPVKDWTWWLMY